MIISRLDANIYHSVFSFLNLIPHIFNFILTLFETAVHFTLKNEIVINDQCTYIWLKPYRMYLKLIQNVCISQINIKKKSKLVNFWFHRLLDNIAYIDTNVFI